MWSQKVVIKGIESSDSTLTTMVNHIEQATYQDTFELYKYASTLMDTLQYQSYLEAAIDSMVVSDSTITLHFYLGRKYNIRRIIFPFVSLTFPRDTIWMLPDDSISIKTQVLSAKRKVLEHGLQNGFPFAAIITEPLIIDSITADYVFHVLPGKQYPIGGYHVVGDLKVSPYYIKRIINLPEESIYTPATTTLVEKKTKDIAFAQPTKPPAVVFTEDKVYMALFLNKKNLNRFDLLLGVQPNTSTIPGVSNKILLTGNALVELINQFGKGERIFAEYVQPAALTQQLKLEGEYPFILSTPIGLQTSYRLFKSDSTFIEQFVEVGMQDYFSFDDRLKAFWNRSTSDLHAIQSAQIISTKKLPTNLDYKTDFFGLELEVRELDYRFNPRSGYTFQAKLGTGRRNIIKNDKILSLKDPQNLDFDFNALYDTVTIQNIMFKPEIDARLYIPFLKRYTCLLRGNLGMLTGPERVYNNEKFRIGGINTLRGWNEQSVFATGFLITTVESRMILDEMSAISVFTDQAFINYNNTKLNQYEWHMGVGAGFSFGTQVGIFGLSAALGRNSKTPFSFQAAKIHFGYQSIF